MSHPIIHAEMAGFFVSDDHLDYQMDAQTALMRKESVSNVVQPNSLHHDGPILPADVTRELPRIDRCDSPGGPGHCYVGPGTVMGGSS
jgi:hypothetical protein